MKGLNQYCKEFNAEIVEKGFWETFEFALSEISLSEFSEKDRVFYATRDAFISQKIMLVVSELGEAIEAMRHNKYGIKEKDTFEDEIADALFRIFDLCGMLDIDIEAQLEWKRSFNKSREKMHGKGF